MAAVENDQRRALLSDPEQVGASFPGDLPESYFSNPLFFPASFIGGNPEMRSLFSLIVYRSDTGEAIPVHPEFIFGSSSCRVKDPMTRAPIWLSQRGQFEVNHAEINQLVDHWATTCPASSTLSEYFKFMLEKAQLPVPSEELDEHALKSHLKMLSERLSECFKARYPGSRHHPKRPTWHKGVLLLITIASSIALYYSTPYLAMLFSGAVTGAQESVDMLTASYYATELGLTKKLIPNTDNGNLLYPNCITTPLEAGIYGCPPTNESVVISEEATVLYNTFKVCVLQLDLLVRQSLDPQDPSYDLYQFVGLSKAISSIWYPTVSFIATALMNFAAYLNRKACALPLVIAATFALYGYIVSMMLKPLETSQCQWALNQDAVHWVNKTEGAGKYYIDGWDEGPYFLSEQSTQIWVSTVAAVVLFSSALTSFCMSRSWRASQRSVVRGHPAIQGDAAVTVMKEVLQATQPHSSDMVMQLGGD